MPNSHVNPVDLLEERLSQLRADQKYANEQADKHAGESMAFREKSRKINEDILTLTKAIEKLVNPDA